MLPLQAIQTLPPTWLHTGAYVHAPLAIDVITYSPTIRNLT